MAMGRHMYSVELERGVPFNLYIADQYSVMV